MAETKTAGAQMRYTPEEINIIQSTFNNNERLVKLLRKVFLPELDPNAPLGQIIDLYMTLPVTAETRPEDVKVAVLARNQIIAHVEGRLMELTVLAQNVVKETNPKDSSK